MKVVFLKVRWWNPKEAAIGLVTASNFCHTAVLLPGESRLLDASESRGDVNFGKRVDEYKNRPVLVYHIPDEDVAAYNYALGMIGTKYDWRGVMGWGFSLNNRRAVYCFEYTLKILAAFKKINGTKTKVIFAETKLYSKIDQTRIDSDDVLTVLEWSRLKPIYEGPANGFTN